MENFKKENCVTTKIYNTYESDNIVYVNKDEDFKILQLSDLHLSPTFTEDFGNDNPERTYNDIRKLVKMTNPNMIVLTGDNLFGFSIERIKELSSVLDEFKLPWTYVYGNHDTHSQSIEEKKLIENECLKSSYCLYRNDFENITLKRRGDHLIQLRLKDTNKLVYGLYMIDSGTYSYKLPDLNNDGEPDGVGYESVYEDQLNQFKKVINSANIRYQEQDDNNFENLPNIIFQHMCVQEYNTAWDLYTKGSNEAKLLFGKYLETPCPGLVNTGQFDVMKEMNTKGMFVGHDHINTFGVEYQGILLAVGGQAGYSNIYLCNSTEPKNGLLITINSKQELSAEVIYINK